VNRSDFYVVLFHILITTGPDTTVSPALAIRLSQKYVNQILTVIYHCGVYCSACWIYCSETSVANYQPAGHKSQESEEDLNSTMAEAQNLTDKNVYNSYRNKNRMEYIRVDIAVSHAP
jgi:hypothetical protein